MQSYRLLDETEQRFHQNFLHRNGNTQVTSLLTVPGCVSALRARKAFSQLVADYPFFDRRSFLWGVNNTGLCRLKSKSILRPARSTAAAARHIAQA
jgi:hypothetical protein